MKRRPINQTEREPSDLQLQLCWSAGLNTADIAEKYFYHEGAIESRIWRLREERRARA